MYNKPDIRLVYSHAERAGRGNHRRFSADKPLLCGAAQPRIHSGVIGDGGNAVIAQTARNFFGFPSGQAVDDAACAVLLLHKPNQLCLAVVDAPHRIVQIGAVKAGHKPLRRAQAEGVHDVLPHLCGGCRSKRGNDRTGGQPPDKLRNAPVAGAKVVPPLRNAVRFVHGDHRNRKL